MKKIAPTSRDHYRAVLRRFYGDEEPDFVPHRAMTASVVAALSAAIQHYWADRGDVDRGQKLAEKVLRSKTTPTRERFRAYPKHAEASDFEWAVREFRKARVSILLLNMLAYAPRVFEMLMSKREAFEQALKTNVFVIEADVAKGGRARALPIVGSARELIQALLNLSAAEPHALKERDGRHRMWRTPHELLVAPGGSFDSARNMLARYIKEISASVGQGTAGWSPHTLRRIFSDRFLRSGGSVELLRMALGHSHVDQTLKSYARDVAPIEPFDPSVLRPFMPKISLHAKKRSARTSAVHTRAVRQSD